MCANCVEEWVEDWIQMAVVLRWRNMQILNKYMYNRYKYIIIYINT